jgi:hypothetical protein
MDALEQVLLCGRALCCAHRDGARAARRPECARADIRVGQGRGGSISMCYSPAKLLFAKLRSRMLIDRYMF